MAKRMKGSYILLLELHELRQISVGKLGILHFTEGCYAYAGSALNGLEARVNRHLRLKKKHHWHIDYLLDRADIYEVVLIPGEEKMECNLAQALDGSLSCVRGFGSSDCKCSGHLFYAYSRNELSACVDNTLTQLGITCHHQPTALFNRH